MTMFLFREGKPIEVTFEQIVEATVRELYDIRGCYITVEDIEDFDGLVKNTETRLKQEAR